MRAPVIYSRICEFTLAEAVSEYDHMYLPLSTLSELHEYEMEAVGRGALPVDDSSCLRHESRAQNLRTGEFSRGMVGSAGTCQPCGLHPTHQTTITQVQGYEQTRVLRGLNLTSYGDYIAVLPAERRWVVERPARGSYPSGQKKTF